MLTSKWHMHRMGLIDFWYYTNEEFYFKNGHILLRGSNGSGKSVTMQSFIPILLDGNKNSERLDAFGTIYICTIELISKNFNFKKINTMNNRQEIERVSRSCRF